MTWKHASRLTAVLLLAFGLALGLTLPALAQSAQESAQMRLYIQQLEAQVRQLTGEVERLGFELRRAQAGLEPAPETTGTAGLTGSISDDPVSGGSIIGGTVNPQNNASITQGAPPQDLGSLSIAVDDPRIAADGAGNGGAAPLDLSALAGGAGTGLSGGTDLGQNQLPPPDGQSPGGLSPAQPPLTAALSGSPRDEYDLSYGYILTGDYDLAEQSFRAWLQNFSDHELVLDARFWLALAVVEAAKLL